MSRPRKTNAHLPKYVTVIHGSYWYRPPEGEYVNIGPEGQEHLVWRFMADKTAPSAPGKTMHDFFERYKREVLPLLGLRTQKDYVRHLVRLERSFGHMRPNEIQPRDIGAFLDRPKGKIQANKQVAVLSAIFSKMVGRWYVADKNPCQHVERNDSHKRSRYITDAEFQTIYSLAKPRIQIAMDLALLTGQRQGDLLSLLQTHVSEDGVFFQQGKTGKRLLVCMSPALKEVLDRAKAMLPRVDIGGYVLRTRKGTRYTGEGFRACWQRMMRKAMKRGLLSERFTFHDIRAKSVSDSKTLEEAFERAGHTSMAMTRGTYDRGIRKVTPLK